MIRHLIFALGFLAACDQTEQPRLLTYGTLNNPVCIAFCDTAVEAASAEGDGNVSNGGVSQAIEAKR